MAIYVDLSKAQPGDVEVLISPLAELAAALHVLAELEHHPEAEGWTELVDSSLTPDLRGELRFFAPLWARYRCRLFFPLSPRRPLPLLGELDRLAALDQEEFLTLAASGVLGVGRSAPPGRDLLTQPSIRESFVEWCMRRSFSRGELARTLVDDSAAFRGSLLSFLRDCDQAFFARWWPADGPKLEISARRLKQDLGDYELADVVAGVSPAGSRVNGTSRVRFDKLQRNDVVVGDRPLILVPSIRGWPHLTVKLEQPWAVVVQYVVEGTGSPLLTQVALHDRLAALATPSNLEICRHLAGEPITTSELSAKLGRSMPEISRSLAHLRAVDLVISERDGKYIHHRLDSDTIMRLGPDFLATITR
jgi:DNA-binding transcriptional ArsR family regulator